MVNQPAVDSGSLDRTADSHEHGYELERIEDMVLWVTILVVVFNKLCMMIPMPCKYRELCTTCIHYQHMFYNTEKLLKCRTLMRPNWLKNTTPMPTCRNFQQLLDGTQLAGVELPVERLVAALGVTLSNGQTFHQPSLRRAGVAGDRQRGT